MSNIDKQAKSVIRELIDDARSRRLGKLIITADEMEVLLAIGALQQMGWLPW